MAIIYVQYSDVQNHLNASLSSDGLTYTVFGLPVAQVSFQAYVDRANVYANAIVGQDLQQSDSRFSWAFLIALDMACLGVLVAASGGMLQGAFDYRLGDLFITKGNISRLAFEGAVKSFQDDLIRALMNFSTPIMAAEATAASEVPTYRGGLMNP
ncbi:MAG: hypothetical protein ABSB10_00565 [Candidatus Bathyarchaeia archaeon]|jgi:hypothetical protein